MEHIFNELILLAKRIYINTNENDRYNSDVTSRNLRFAKQLMDRYPAHKYHRAQPILKKLAMIKSPLEVEVMQEAMDITAKAFRRVLEFVKPGQIEYEIEAEITHEFIRNGANGHAYEPIVASGINSCVLHYTQNNQVCQDGDLLLMDFGAEYANYAADLTRTIPVNGQFTERQRAVYNAVLRVLKNARQMLVPGALLQDYHREVGKMMESELLALKLITKTDIKNQDPSYPALQEVFHARHFPPPGPRCARPGQPLCAPTSRYGLYLRTGHLHPRRKNWHPPGKRHPRHRQRTNRPDGRYPH